MMRLLTLVLGQPGFQEKKKKAILGIQDKKMNYGKEGLKRHIWSYHLLGINLMVIEYIGLFLPIMGILSGPMP